MKLPNEVTHKKSAALGLTWAIVWRLTVVAIAFGVAVQLVPSEYRQENRTLLMVFEWLAALLIYWATVHWVLQRGFGSVKIILMEHAHYQELVKKLDDNEAL